MFKNNRLFAIIFMNRQDYVDKYGLSFFTRACYDGHLDACKALTRGGKIDIHYQDDYGFRIAAEQGHIDIVEYLASIGSNIEAKNNAAIRNAFDEGNKEMFEKILDLKKNKIQLEVNKAIEAIRNSYDNNNKEMFAELLNFKTQFDTVKE